jgi:low temperature requirement protein LtrA
VTQVRQPRIHRRGEDEEASVSTLELFFDLVFVFALTQVTAFMAQDISARSVVQGVLIVVLLWWAWTGYAWLANVVSAEEPAITVVMLAAMAAMFLLALCIPEAYDDGAGGLDGPLVLALCYLAFRVMHLVMFVAVARDDPVLRAQLARFTPSVFGSSIVLLVAAATEGPTQTWLWVLALVVDYVGTALGGSSGWRLPAPGHFAERHGLIIIVALGESIVAIGVGVAQLPVTWPIIAASLLALFLVQALWWAYFDVSALLGEHALAREPAATRPRLARNAYSFAHLPLMVGIVLVALGLKKVLEYVADTEHHDLSEPLKGAALGALVLGLVTYLVAHVLFKHLVSHQLSPARLVAAVVQLVAWAPLREVPALGLLGVALLVVVVALGSEAVVHRERRREIRSGRSGH